MILAVAANAVTAFCFAALAGLCAYAMFRLRPYLFPLLFLLIAAVVVAAVSVSNILERVAHFTLIDRFEEYQESLILPFILLFSYSWSAASRSQLNEKYIALLHHRVKNDLQIVDSLIELQADAEGPEAETALRAARDRVSVIGLAERMSLERGAPMPIEMGAFLAAVAALVSRDRCADSAERYASSEDIRMEAYYAIPCGLLVAEAERARIAARMANGVGPANEPRPRISALGEGRYRLSLAVSLPSGFSSELADALVSQLGGQLQDGLETVVEFAIGTGEGHR